mgnify:CR=1 FL=1
MKTLYLVRHAKSSWSIDQIEDRDRPLKGRGIRDAHLVSQYIYENMEAQQTLAMYVSPATRALHTALIFARTMGIPAKKLKLEDELYHCGVSDLVKSIKGAPELCDTVFYFAHNPAVTDFVNAMTNARISNVPTTGVVCIRFHVDRWQDIDAGAELIQFEYPKRLKAK